MYPARQPKGELFLPVKDCQDMDDPETKPENQEGNGSACGKEVRQVVFSNQSPHPSKLFPEIKKHAH